MIQIRAEDVALKQMLSPRSSHQCQVQEATHCGVAASGLSSYIKATRWPQGWLFSSYRDSRITCRQVQNILDDIATRAGLQEVKWQDKAGKDRHRIHPSYAPVLLRHL
jgi:hypothetical protein